MRTLLNAGLVLLLVGIFFVSANAAKEDPVMAYYMTVGDHFGVSYDNVNNMAKKVSMEEVAVVFFIANRAEVSPQEVLSKRKQGFSWYPAVC